MKPGEIAYNAYAKAVEWKSIKGEPLPEYSEQSERLQRAWEQAAAAVIAAILRGDIVLHLEKGK